MESRQFRIWGLGCREGLQKTLLKQAGGACTSIMGPTKQPAIKVT